MTIETSTFEALEASLLAHVVDASDPGFERQLAVTEEVLDEIGAKDVPRLLVHAAAAPRTKNMPLEYLRGPHRAAARSCRTGSG